jgi:hypothetical protein
MYTLGSSDFDLVEKIENAESNLDAKLKFEANLY